MSKWPYILTKAATCRALGYVPSTATRWGNKPPQHVRVFLLLYAEHEKLKVAHAAECWSHNALYLVNQTALKMLEDKKSDDEGEEQ